MEVPNNATETIASKSQLSPGRDEEKPGNTKEVPAQKVTETKKCFTDDRAWVRNTAVSDGVGDCLHYHYRVEYQKRGAGHIHGVIWLE